MKFRDITNLVTFVQYCKIKNTVWTYKPVSIPNELEIQGLFIMYDTPLAFVCANGTIYYLNEYTGKYFISLYTAWYLHHLSNLEFQFKINQNFNNEIRNEFGVEIEQGFEQCDIDEFVGLPYKEFVGYIGSYIVNNHIHGYGWLSNYLDKTSL